MQVSRNLLIQKISHCFPFNHLGESAISDLIDHSEVLFFEKGQTIFKQGASGNHLYLLLEGEVGISRELDGRMVKVNRKNEGSIFGEEALMETTKRVTAAQAEANLMVLKVPAAIARLTQSKDPVFANSLKLLANAFTNLLEIRNGAPSGEEIFYVGRPHYYLLYLRLIPAGLLLIGTCLTYLLLVNGTTLISGFITFSAAILAFVLFGLWQVLEWSKNMLLITDKRVISKKVRLLRTENVMDTPLTAVMKIRSIKPLAGKLFGFGHLSIDTYTGENLVSSIPLVESVQGLVEFLTAAAKSDNIVKEQEAFKKILVERQTRYGFTEGERNRETDGEDADSFAFSADNQVVTYRTHWLMLLKKVLLPSLLFIFVILTSAFFYFNEVINSGSLLFFTFAFFTLSFSLIWWIYQFFDWYNDRFQLFEHQIIDINQKPFGREEKRSASIYNIQSIRFERKGLIGILLNFGTVYIRIGDEEFTFDHVPKPAEVQSRIFNLLEASLAGKQINELTSQQIRLANWLEAYQQFRNENEQSPK
jgi:uncharacterized membrane protein YdbT with pleckstrin-like domain